MMWFITSPIGRYVLVGVAVALLLGGAAFWIYHKGGEAERGKAAIETIKETDDARKDREAAERRARDSNFCDQLNRLPGPRVACP